MEKVVHQPEQLRFVVELSKEPAHLDYVVLDDKRIDFQHTFVPFRQRGQGHAEALVEAGLSWAKQQGFTIQASCWYVDKFLKAEQ
jgi:predicted GNAT family acetyltransferase